MVEALRENTDLGRPGLSSDKPGAVIVRTPAPDEVQPIETRPFAKQKNQERKQKNNN